MPNKGNRNNKNKGRRNGRGAMEKSRMIPRFSPTLTVSKRVRFSPPGAVNNASITRKNLLNLFEIAASAVTAYRLFESVRVMAIEVWSPSTSGLATPAYCSIEWLGSNSPSSVVSDMSMSTYPAYIKTSPPARSSAQWWSISGSDETDTLFAITCGAGSVVDVHLVAKLPDFEAGTLGDAPTGASTGTLYFNYLDGISSAGITPIGGSVMP